MHISSKLIAKQIPYEKCIKCVVSKVKKERNEKQPASAVLSHLSPRILNLHHIEESLARLSGRCWEVLEGVWYREATLMGTLSFLKVTDSTLAVLLSNSRSLLISRSHYHREARALDERLVSLA